MSDTDIFKNEEKFESFKASQMIFEEGQPGDTMYILLEGEVDIFVGNKLIDTVTPGGILGEMALIDNSPRSASAITKTDCKLVRVNENHFLYLIQQKPYFSLEVMRVMAERLRRLMIAQAHED